jgi:Ca2+/H+ antiporter, TMEM165/GDT1 family
LIIAAVIWGSANHLADGGLDAAMMASIVSLSAGAVLANVTSVILLILETMMVRH